MKYVFPLTSIDQEDIPALFFSLSWSDYWTKVLRCHSILWRSGTNSERILEWILLWGTLVISIERKRHWKDLQLINVSNSRNLKGGNQPLSDFDAAVFMKGSIQAFSSEEWDISVALDAAGRIRNGMAKGESLFGGDFKGCRVGLISGIGCKRYFRKSIFSCLVEIDHSKWTTSGNSEMDQNWKIYFSGITWTQW